MVDNLNTKLSTHTVDKLNTKLSTHTQSNEVQNEKEEQSTQFKYEQPRATTRLSKGRKDAQISSETFLLNNLPPNKKKETQKISALKATALSSEAKYRKMAFSELLCSLLLLLGSPSLFSLDFSFFSS